jgi:hypothetical protein
MAWSYEIDPARRRVRVRVVGSLCDQDLVDGDAELRGDPEFDPAYDQLVDLREAEGSAVSSEGVWELANRPPLFLPTSRRAILVATDLGFGMARMFEMMRGEKSGVIRVFESLDSAELWLESQDSPGP